MYAIRSYYAQQGAWGNPYVGGYLQQRHPSAFETQEMPAMNLMPPGPGGVNRITSYNVCYTKLLRHPMDDILYDVQMAEKI